MAKSIRISDEFYEFADAVAQRSGRSLAQQLEHWARLGARIDMGLPAAQTMELLDGQLDVAELLKRFLPSVDRATVQAKHAKLDAQVANGQRDASSLAVIPKALAQSVSLTFPKDAFGGAKRW